MIGEATEFEINPVSKIEKGLGFFMRPVDPDPEFVQKLGVRLRYPKKVALEGRSPGRVTALLVLIAGLAAGIISIYLLRRLR